MNYIITGGTGFIGTHLTNLLNEVHPEAKVWNLDIVKPGTPNPVVKNYKSAVRDGEQLGSTYIECDIRKPIGELSFTPTAEDVIFNFAAVHRTPGHEDIEYFETNIRGAENVCAFAEKYGIKNMVFTSSIAPYGASEQLKTEDTLPTPNTPYGISKLVAEKIHMAWQKGGEGRKLTIVRPGVVFGRGENGNFSRLYWGIRKHTFAYPGRKDTIKACVYVKELVRFILWNVEERKTSFDIYNCTFEPAYTIEQIVKAMKKVTGLSQSVPYIPNSIIMPMAVCAKMVGSPMGICPARVKKLQISTNICGKKMASSGYQMKWTFEEALADWYEDNKQQCLE
ncbi:NAD-dependent epimerase/dehydratase family protein [Xylanibacter ruminicola]|uniref:NAD dependent epimerase/dehydratase family protein n=1 Tax=Xylanibacter ruminicola (strain ATCC 19189 / DSM 19721 / CIP 105475 / JCM 8958 / 23) TaxID=264731 RepID=D5ETU3_XYLR2|nr:NAD(P)-dependent oxidoreductase [Xylanibacter ruminicola]ADE82012.1 NAD dependent epimerase/dehydratase family protein [Xylanibacter ruminicola 23]